ncbi:unnamed protein product [Mytilus edulis]|uniref:Uncharacterized protein n=1 Tax=Mytilus edulis TaxID=6550 RepID=A0A8S3QED0_MYTED|nr:unnamed protein product [Mytilus edulis]
MNILTCGPLFTELKDSIDIYLLQEHWLFHCQLKMLNDILHNYNGVGKVVDSSDPITPWRMSRGYGGTAILWKKNLESIVTPLTIGNNRIHCIEINGDSSLIKITTQELRKLCGIEAAQKRIQDRNEIIEARSSNKTLFYKLINQQRGKLSRRIDELNVGDNIYNTLDQIMEGWKIHFGQLAENTLDENFDSNYLKTTENEYKNIIELCKAEIHIKILTIFGNITRANENSCEWRLVERQLQIKSKDSNSWFIDMKKICIKYNLENPLSLLYNELSKGKWKKMTTTAVQKYSTTRIKEEIMYYFSMKYIPKS